MTTAPPMTETPLLPVEPVDQLPAPRRRVVLELKAQGDSWQDIRYALRTLETEIACDGCLSAFTVSGGYSAGWSYVSNEDKAITHDSWAEANDAYCRQLGEREATAIRSPSLEEG